MRAMGLSDNDVIDKLRHPEFYQNSIDAANDDGLIRKIKPFLSSIKSCPGEPPSVSGRTTATAQRFLILKDMI